MSCADLDALRARSKEGFDEFTEVAKKLHAARVLRQRICSSFKSGGAHRHLFGRVLYYASLRIFSPNSTPTQFVSLNALGFIISPHNHIALALLWDRQKDSTKLTTEEQSHLSGCARCDTALALCNQSKTLEEAERRYKIFVING